MAPHEDQKADDSNVLGDVLTHALDGFFDDGDALASSITEVTNELRCASLDHSIGAVEDPTTRRTLDQDIAFLLEDHSKHDDDGLDGDSQACDSPVAYNTIFSDTLQVTERLVARLLAEDEDDETPDHLEEDLLPALDAVLLKLAENAPLCVFRHFTDGLQSLTDLTVLVPLVIAMSKLLDVDPDALVNITERLPVDAWLLHTRWFLVVNRLTNTFPWFGPDEDESALFWLALRNVLPTMDQRLEALTVLETLADRESDEHETDEVEPCLTLRELQSYLVLFTGPSRSPFSVRDLPRLARQATRWSLLQPRFELDTSKKWTPEHVEFRLALCLYYVEHIEDLYEVDTTWGDSFVTAWQHRANKCMSVTEFTKVLVSMQQVLRNTVAHLTLHGREGLEGFDPSKGPLLDSDNKSMPIEDLTVDDVVGILRKAEALPEELLLRVRNLASAVVRARSKRADASSDSESSPELKTLVQLDRTVRAVYGFDLYAVQVVAIVCATCCSTSSAAKKLATVLQMETGEGKSVVFAVIAGFFALNDRMVDIATSSSQLAADGDRDAAGFFDELRISHSVRGEGEHSEAPHSCYASQIVFGTVSDLAGDHLRELIFGGAGRGSRSFDVLLLDEVDAALVDGAGNLTMLSMNVVGMERLYYLYGVMLQSVKRLTEVTGDRAAMPDHTDPEFRKMLGLPPIAGADGTQGDVDEESKSEGPDAVTHSEASTSGDHDDAASSFQMIPNYLLPMCDKKLKVYIEHAWATQTWFRKGRQYDVRDDQIVVIDNNTSGEYQGNSIYSEGLHQFLQIEHGCELTPESFNSVFISNSALARRYEIVVGITGTIGSERDRQAMRTAFGNDDTLFAVLPRSKRRPYTQFPPLVMSSDAGWRDCWLHEVQHCVNEQRPVLVIFADKETACREADFLHQQLQRPIHRYIINEPDLQTFSASQYKLKPGDVVVSTTFGGRGTDYKLSDEAVASGGLDTVLTFYATSIRGMDQAFGRSARAGNPGSGMLITMNLMCLSDDLFARRMEEQVTRDKEYSTSLSEQLKTNVPLNECCDQLFQRFAELYKRLRQRFEGDYSYSAIDCRHLLRALRDRFGLLIEELRQDVAGLIAEDESRRSRAWIKDYVNAQYKAWFQQVLKDVNDGYLVASPRSLVVYARDLPKFESDRALEMTERAIASDAAFAGPPAFVLRLKLSLGSKKCNPRIKSDYTEMKTLLTEARDAFSAEIEFVGGQHELVVQHARDSKLDAQLTERQNVLFILRDSVQQALADLEAGYNQRGKDDDDKYYVEFSVHPFPDDPGAAAKRVFHREFFPNGYLGPVQLETKREWTWDWNAFGALMLGVGQAIGGALAMVFSAGAYGASIVMEGISDIVSGITSIVKGDGSFSWKDYFVSKALSLAVAIVCAGVCKAVKFVKSVAQRSMNFAKSAWKNGLRTTLAAKKATIKAVEQTAVKEVTKVTVKEITQVGLKKSFKVGLAKCGTQMGKIVAKQLILVPINYAVDESIKKAFEALETKIDALVRNRIETWVDGEQGVKIERMHHLILGTKGTISAAHLIIESSKYKLSEQQSQRGEFAQIAEQFGRQLGDSLASELASHMEKRETIGGTLLALGVHALVEGAKFTEMTVHVMRFVDVWLAIVEAVITEESEHLLCVDVTCAAKSWEEWRKRNDNALVLHMCGDRTHWQPTDLDSVETLQKSEPLQQAIRSVDISLTEAASKLRSVRSVDSTSRSVSWDSVRSMIVSSLARVATAFIRNKCEERAGAFSKRLAAYGAKKLVDKTVSIHLGRKAKRLQEKKEDPTAEAKRQKRLDRFLMDNEVNIPIEKVIEDVRGAGAASQAVLNTIAQQEDVQMVIHHEDGSETVMNPHGNGAPMHFNESGSGKMRHLTPRTSGEDGEPYDEGQSDKSCLYRAYLYHKLGRNATDDEIQAARKDVAGWVVSNTERRLDLYINRKPKRAWGGKKGGSKKHVPQRNPAEDGAVASSSTPLHNLHYDVIERESNNFAESGKNKVMEGVKLALAEEAAVSKVWDCTPGRGGDKTLFYIVETKNGYQIETNLKTPGGFRVDLKHIGPSTTGQQDCYKFDLQRNGGQKGVGITTFAAVVAPKDYVTSKDGAKLILNNIGKSLNKWQEHRDKSPGKGVTIHLVRKTN